MVSLNLDGSAPNTNAQLDIKSTGLQGKGLLIPRMTEAQRTSNLSVIGGLVNLLGQLHGGPAQGLLVYQTDGAQGFYYNTSTTSTPSWQYLAPNGSGSAGPTGPTGAAGATGAAGVAEAWLTGSGAPTGGQGIVGDWYFRTSNSQILEKTGSTTWTSRATITGATGATGPTGAAGAAGAAGSAGATGPTGAAGASSAWYSGNGNVGNGQYNVGDWYLRTNTGDVFEKTGSLQWTLRMNIMGPTGPTGSGGSGSGWALTGNAASSGNFLGTTNSQPLLFKVNNTTAGYLGSSDYNAFFGPAVEYSGGGTYNTGIGYDATIYGSITHSIAIGSGAQVQPGSGSTEDIAIGKGANVTGGSAFSYSLAIGSAAQVQASNGIAIGKSANVNTQYGMAIGDGATGTKQQRWHGYWS
ncbi:MAG: hypothetical protein M0D57_13925 [Sphingobacteriales bacterium JAD_PAG50586_3]|nr:MAG: hypothetical protein M0D57_13925 [Sphingobacteriales bacterium JAD_PAG50586_3]